jgi:hypothetical protein
MVVKIMHCQDPALYIFQNPSTPLSIAFPSTKLRMEAVTVSFSADAPPLSVLAAAKVTGVNISVNAGALPSGSPPELLLSSGLVFFPFSFLDLLFYLNLFLLNS